jgi:tetratricopeptide (TPR) repeat protein
MKKRVLPVLACIAFSFVSCVTAPNEKDIAAEYFAIAEGYAGIAKYDKAIDFYKKASRSPDFVNACDYGLGRMYALSGQWDDACAIFQRLYLREKTNAFTASAYAFSLASSGKSEEALEVYETLYLSDMENPKKARDYAEILVLSKRYQEALDQIELIRSQFPDTDAVKNLDALEKNAKDGLNPPKEKESSGDGKGSVTEESPNPGSADSGSAEKPSVEKPSSAAVPVKKL